MMFAMPANLDIQSYSNKQTHTHTSPSNMKPCALKIGASWNRNSSAALAKGGVWNREWEENDSYHICL